MAGHLSGGRRAWPGGKVTTGEEPRGAEASGERHAPSGWQRCLSNYTVSLFLKCSLLFVIVLRLQCFQHFLCVLCVFWLFGFVQRFLSYQAAQGFQNLEGF